MWLDHLESVHQNRKAGAKKAAETRKKNQAQVSTTKNRKQRSKRKTKQKENQV